MDSSALKRIILSLKSWGETINNFKYLVIKKTDIIKLILEKFDAPKSFINPTTTMH